MTDAYTYHFIFTDIVGLSEPNRSTEEQTKKIIVLNDSIRVCKAFKSIPQKRLIILPTGDGAAIGFPDKMNLPLDLAIELHKKLRKYNRNKDEKDIIKIRIGIHSAPVMRVKDLHGRENVWGEGIIMARRIMDAGNADHILLGSHIGKSLWNLSSKYKKILFSAGIVTFKHRRQEFVYYAYGKDFGNNKTFEIENLNVEAKDSDFVAEILDKKKFRLGETIRTKVKFKGKLFGGFYDNMFLAPDGKKFPGGGIDWWCADHNTHSDLKGGPGNLVGKVKKESIWSCSIPLNYPTGKYTVFIRVYDHLPSGQRTVIREKMETIEITE